MGNKEVKTIYGLRPVDDKPEYRTIKDTDLICPFCGSTFEVKFIDTPVFDNYYSANMFGRVAGKPMRLHREDHEHITLRCSGCHVELSNMKITTYTLYDESDDTNKTPDMSLVNNTKSIAMDEPEV